MNNTPKLITLPQVKNKGGILSYAENPAQIPFDVKRLYWIYGHEQTIIRGSHYHPHSERMLVSFGGRIDISLTNVRGKNHHYQLSMSNQALFVPNNHWTEINLPPGSVLLVLASCKFEDDHTSEDFEQFQALSHE